MHIPHGRLCPVGKNQSWSRLHTGIDLSKAASEDRFRLRSGLPYHDRHAALENSRLFEGNLVKCVAEQVTVIQANAGDNTQFRIYYVRAVKTSAETDFDNGHIHVHICKPFESQACSYLEERQFHLVELALPLLQKIIDIFLRNQLGRPIPVRS